MSPSTHCCPALAVAQDAAAVDEEVGSSELAIG
jgi:hypothetical protein